MKKIRHPILLIAIGVLLTVGAGILIYTQIRGPEIELADFEKIWLKKHRDTIRYAPLPDAPPFDYIDGDGRHQGITADYVRLIEKKLGVHFIEVHLDTMEAVRQAWENGEVDLVGSLQDRSERRDFLRFTYHPYYSVGNVILMRKGALPQYRSLDELKHASIAIVEGSATYEFVRERFPDYRIDPVTSVSNGFTRLSARKVDTMIADKGVASFYIEQRGFPEIEITGEVDYVWNLHFATHVNHPALKSIMDKALGSITPLQRLEINGRWMAKAEKEKFLTRITIVCLLLTLVAAGSFTTWNRMLKKQVRHRTRELGHARHGQQQADRARDESEGRFRAMVESSNDMVWEMDRHGNYTYVSPRVTDILGYPPDQVIGRGWFSFMVPADASKTLQLLRQATPDTILDGQTATLLRRDGREVVLETNGIAYADHAGHLAGFRGVARDITGQLEAESALKASEERFRNLVETTSDWIWETDTKGHYTYASPQVLNVLGYAPDELIGKRFTESMPPREAATMYALFREVAEQGGAIDSKVNINQHKRGGQVVLETSAVPFYDKNWNIRGYRGISRNITERTEAEKRLEFERTLFRSFMEHVPYLIYFKDSHGRFIEVNAAKAEEVDLKPEEVIGKTDFDFLPEDQAQVRYEEELEVMRTEKPLQKEEFCTYPEGDRWYLTTKLPRYDGQGRVVGTFGTSWDITYRKQAREELRRLRAQLSNIIDSMPSILVGVDVEGRITQWNREAEKATGIPSDEAAGRPLKEVFPRLSGEMVKVERAIREKRTQKEERIASRDDGHTHYSDITVYPLLENEAKGAVIRIDDVTDRVRIEEMMVQSEKMMSVGGLAAGMAHEINNPLAGILQNLQVMQNRLTQPSERNLAAAEQAGTSLKAIQTYLQERGLINMMDSITEAGRRAAKVVDNMLSFSRKEDAFFAENDLRQLLDRSLELASNDYNLKKRFDFRHIRIERDYDPNLRTVPCEAGQIQQVILNLLTNSAQAMAQQDTTGKPPAITLRLKGEAAAALIEIEDNGPGMDAETRKRAFEPFFTTKEVGQGTGLGLSVSFFIITENHGGTMRVRSTPGVGTCFSIRIPFERRQARWGLRL